MGVTEFRERVRKAYPNMNKVESRRLDNLTTRYLKHSLKSILGIGVAVTDSNIKSTWHKLNIQEAKWDAFHRQERHKMRTSKFVYVDYSDIAYNNHADDL